MRALLRDLGASARYVGRWWLVPAASFGGVLGGDAMRHARPWVMVVDGLAFLLCCFAGLLLTTLSRRVDAAYAKHIEVAEELIREQRELIEDLVATRDELVGQLRRWDPDFNRQMLELEAKQKAEVEA